MCSFLVQFLGGLGAVLWAKITVKSDQVMGCFVAVKVQCSECFRLGLGTNGRAVCGGYLVRLWDCVGGCFKVNMGL